MKTTATDSGPLYQRVANDITAHITSGRWRPGDKLPSERELCEHYSVSQITVRRALRELAHEGRVYSHHGLGWFIHDEPEARSAQNVTLVLPELDWLTAPVVRALYQELSSRSVKLHLGFTGNEMEEGKDALDGLLAQDTGALLLMATGPERGLGQRYARLVDRRDIPALLLMHDLPDLGLPALDLDESACMEQITHHVLSLGHRRVAYAGGDPNLVEGQQRYRGFASVLWENGLELPMDWVFAGSLRTDVTRRCFQQVFSSSMRPTALICASDTQAAEALQLLGNMHLACPEDVAVVGFGDRDFAPLLSVPLTSFRLDLHGLGKAAAEATTSLLSGTLLESRVFTGQIVTRRSCGAYLSRSM